MIIYIQVTEYQKGKQSERPVSMNSILMDVNQVRTKSSKQSSGASVEATFSSRYPGEKTG